MRHIEPHPVGKPWFFDLPAIRTQLEWLMTADPDDAAQFLGGDAGANWADRVSRVIAFVETEQAARAKPAKVDACPDCGEEWPACVCREDDGEDDRDEWERCGCPYCFCHNRTEYGEPCGDCVAHAHQG